MGIGIEWDWRIESRLSILCGSSDEDAKRVRALTRLRGARIETVSFVGRLPELALSFTNGLHLASFMSGKGQPDWTIFDNRTAIVSWLTVKRGRMVVERQVV